MFFCVSFNYTILRDTRDTLLVTAPGSGAEAIPFIKVWVVVPMAIAFMLFYAKMSNVLSKRALFYATLLPFLFFYALFAFVLYPCRDSLHPTAVADHLQSILPVGFKGFIALFRNWTFAFFYAFAELWGAVILSLVFWGFANDITPLHEAKRFYPIFGIGANVALLASGPLMMRVAKWGKTMAAGDSWEVSLKVLMSAVLASGIVLMLVFSWIQKHVLTDPRLCPQGNKEAKKGDRPRMSLKDSFGYLLRSRYLGLIALLVFAFNMCINLVEVTWKSQLKLLYPCACDYSAFMGAFSTMTGVVTILMMLFVGSNIIRKLGWLAGALVTPLVLLVTGFGFFNFVLFKEHTGWLTQLLGVSSLSLAVLFGAAQNLLSKSCKYSLFDPTKEMAYIPLDQESKVKGKAAIDIVGSRLGKSGGSLVQQGLLIVFGSMASIIPYIAGCLFLVIGIWALAAMALGKRFNALQTMRPENAAAP